MSSARPMLFGRYCLLERISVGGMAEVFRAKPLNTPKTSRYLALKRILPHLAEDEEFLRMFVDEAKLCVHLRHPNIVHIYELGRFQASSYILMEFIPGQDLLALQKRLRKRKLIMSVAQACYVAMELAKGLDYAHKATDDYGRPLGIIHRDISPQNVLINYSGGVKLIDFGVAKAAIQSTKTQVGVLKGKFGYMSPEQIRGDAIDHRSDVFAVGTVLWELLTNRRLFTGANDYEVFQKVREAAVDPPSVKNPQVPPEVDRIVMKALSRQVEDRYEQANDLARDLGLFLTSIEPLYTAQMLSAWMADFFSAELAEEHGKAERFDPIRTAEDVRRAFVQEEALAGGGLSEQGGPQVDATQVWDAEVAPGEGEDLEAFAAAHTTVAAGGFDLNEFMTLRDDDILESLDVERTEAPAASTQEPTVEVSAYNPSVLRSSVATTQGLQGATPLSTTVDGSGTQPRGQVGSSSVLTAARRRRNLHAAIAAALVFCCLALAAASLLLLVLGERPPQGGSPPEGFAVTGQAVAPAATTGTLLLTSSPDTGLRIAIDDRPRPETSTPLKIERLERGPHRVTITDLGGASFEEVIEVPERGGLIALDVVLSAE